MQNNNTRVSTELKPNQAEQQPVLVPVLSSIPNCSQRSLLKIGFLLHFLRNCMKEDNRIFKKYTVDKIWS